MSHNAYSSRNANTLSTVPEEPEQPSFSTPSFSPPQISPTLPAAPIPSFATLVAAVPDNPVSDIASSTSPAPTASSSLSSVSTWSATSTLEFEGLSLQSIMEIKVVGSTLTLFTLDGAPATRPLSTNDGYIHFAHFMVYTTHDIPATPEQVRPLIEAESRRFPGPFNTLWRAQMVNNNPREYVALLVRPYDLAELSDTFFEDVGLPDFRSPRIDNTALAGYMRVESSASLSAVGGVSDGGQGPLPSSWTLEERRLYRRLGPLRAYLAFRSGPRPSHRVYVALRDTIDRLVFGVEGREG